MGINRHIVYQIGDSNEIPTLGVQAMKKVLLLINRSAFLSISLLGSTFVGAQGLVVAPLQADLIEKYEPGPLYALQDVRQASALFVRGDEICVLQNGGGRLLCSTDPTDPNTNIIRLGNQNGCGDIEGGWAYDEYDLYADERTPARIYFMIHGGRKCTRAFRTIILNGMDETRGSFGIEGVSALADGRIVVVKERSPVRVAVFSLEDGVNNYTPTDLFPVQNCSRLGDVTVKTNGNLLLLCKSPKKVQEYSLAGVLMSELAIPQFNQPEGIAELPNGDIGILGEPNQYQVFTSGEPPDQTL